MIRFPYLLGLSFLLLFFYSCQNSQKSNAAGEIEISDNVVAAEEPAVVEEAETAETDTLTISDRKWDDGDFHSHIELDFALATVQVADTSQIRLVDKICAISVIPVTTWINAQQEEMGESWIEVAGDNQYYNQLAIDTLEALEIPTNFAPREKRFVKFIKTDKTDFTIDLTKMKDAWGLILFNGTDNPVYWSSTDIDSELKEIYKK